MKFAYLADTTDLVPYAISALLIDEKDWRASYDVFKDFRKNIKRDFSLKLDEPVCFQDLAKGYGSGSMPPGKGRLFLSSFAQMLSSLPVTIVSVVSRNGGAQKDALRRRAFPILMQRIERNCEAAGGYRFAVVCGDDMNQDICSVSRKIRVYNPLPGGSNVPMEYLIEDSFLRDLNTSHLLKSADFAAFLYRVFFLFRNGDADSDRLLDYKELDREFIFRIFYVWSERGILMEKASMTNQYGMVTIR